MDKYFPKDEEYHFNEPSGGDIFGTPKKTNPILEKLKNRNLLLAIGGIVAFFIFYKVIGLIIHATQTKTIKPVAKTTHQQQEMTISPAQITNNRLTTLESRATATNTRLEQLETMTTDMQNNVNQLQTQISNLTNSVQVLSNQIAQQQADFTALIESQKKPVTKKKTARRVAAAPRTTYYLQGLVPGRAWLKDSSGSSVTVQVGDKLPGYGSIEQIDPLTGKVMTSSGIIIRYSPADR